MADIRLALPTIFLHEGGYVNNVKDPGGATNFGVSLKFLITAGDLDGDGWLDGDVNHDGKIDVADIKAMTKTDAGKIYDLYWWSRYRYALIDDQAVATKVFDLAINMGHIAAHKCLQRAVRAATQHTLKEDGVLGDLSFKAINLANPLKLLPALKSEAAGTYRAIRLKNGNEQAFITGWLNRAYSDAILEWS